MGAILLVWGIVTVVAVVGINLIRICQIKGAWDILREK